MNFKKQLVEFNVIGKKEKIDYENLALNYDITPKNKNNKLYKVNSPSYKKFVRTEMLNLFDLQKRIETIDNIIRNINEQERKIKESNRKEEILRKQIEKQVRENQQDIFKNLLRKDLIKLRDEQTPRVIVNLENLFNTFDKKQGIETVIKLIDRILLDKIVLLRCNDKYYSLNNRTKENLLKFIEDQTLEEEHYRGKGSDTEIIYTIIHAEELVISLFKKVNKKNKAFGAFFKYTHNLDIDLERYGIFKNDEDIIYNDNCLITALKNGGLSDNKINDLRLECKNAEIPKNKLKDICERYRIQIKITKPKLNKNDSEIIGKEFNEIYNVGLIENHYFIIEPTNYTSYSIKNYNEIKDIDGWNKIYKKNGNNYKKSNERFINSYDLISLLIENKDKYLTQITNENSNIAMTQYYNRVDDDIINLDYDIDSGKNYKKIENKEKEDNNSKLIFFDFETYTDKNRKHIPYLVCYLSEDGRKGTFYGSDCAKQMLNDLSLNYKNICLIAHNASYDYRFLTDNFTIFNEINKGTKLFTSEGKFRNMNIKVKDSYLLISHPLREFGDLFNLEVKKEVMPYDLYNKTNAVQEEFVYINTALNYIKEKEREQFLTNIKEWNLEKDNKFNCLKYSALYCELDCEVLKQGYLKFREWMLKLVNLDINNILTIASLAHKYFINEGCYEGVYEISGVPQQFIQKCVVGGRTMCCNNEKQIFNLKNNKKLKMQDFDAVSLYPSAMKRMDGFLKGLPKVIKNLDFNEIKKYDGYFIEIKIKKVGIKRQFSQMSYINDKGVRIFTNEMIGKTIYVDKIALEDMIEFQKIEFDVIRGYYFNEGFNTKIKETIKNVFEERIYLKNEITYEINNEKIIFNSRNKDEYNNKIKELKEKKIDYIKGNPAQLIYKLIMNSGYGKSIMKPVESETKIFNDEEKFKVYLSNNYTWIQEFSKLDNSNKVRVKVLKPINEHFNIAHIGVSILSMSKRIMNEVMNIAEDNNLKIYYQDTDSMHIKEDDIKTLEKEFKNKYNRELIGKEMGQFHSDFNLIDSNGKECKKVYATKSIFLGKKSYIDELEGEDEKGNKVKGYHIRMKGIPESCIHYTVKQYKLNNPFELYEKLLDGKEIIFDLTEGDNKANFKFNKDGTIITISKGLFTRTLKFEGKINEDEEEEE